MVSAGPLNGHPVDLYMQHCIRFGHKSSLCSFIDTFVLNIWIWLVDLRKMYKCVQPCTYSNSPVYATIFTVCPFETILFFVNCVPEKGIPKMNHSESDWWKNLSLNPYRRIFGKWARPHYWKTHPIVNFRILGMTQTVLMENSFEHGWVFQ